MAEFPALPLWTDAYLGDTTHLTTIEHGAYLLLLMSMWRRGGSLPDDDKLLARYAKLTPGQWARMSATIRAFFKAEKGLLTQGRLTDEYNAVRQHSIKQSNNVKARWLKTKDKADTKPESGIPSGNTPLPLPLTHTEGGGGSARARENPPQEILPPQTFREQLLDAIGADPISGLIGPNGRQLGTQADMAEAARWLGLPGITEAVAVAEVHRLASTKADGPPASFRYFTQAMCRLSGALAEPTLTPLPGAPRKESRHDQRAFNRAIDAIADGLDAGTVHVRDSGRDPFAQFGE